MFFVSAIKKVCYIIITYTCTSTHCRRQEMTHAFHPPPDGHPQEGGGGWRKLAVAPPWKKNVHHKGGFFTPFFLMGIALMVALFLHVGPFCYFFLYVGFFVLMRGLFLGLPPPSIRNFFAGAHAPRSIPPIPT